jgi:hypothetical protein
VEDGIAHLRSYEQIIVHPRCKNFYAECKLYRYKMDERSGDILPVIVDKHNHLMDAARYALEPMVKPKRMPGFLFSNHENEKTCPRCESLLPDDGLCPHCGEDAVAVAMEVSGLPMEEITLDDFVVPSTGNGHTNGNGNGHSNGNGNGHAPKRRMLRGLNG